MDNTSAIHSNGAEPLTDSPMVLKTAIGRIISVFIKDFHLTLHYKKKLC